MYRNCVYEPKEKKVYLFTWDEDGNRVTEEHLFYPYLYLEDPKGEHTSIHGTKLRKKVFSNSYERNVFIRESGIKRLFENIQPAQQFLIDKFWQVHEDLEFTKHPLKIWFLDIELMTSGKFPKVDDPIDPINIISFYDSVDKKIYSYATSPYTGDNKDVIYTYCETEEELLYKFIEHLERDYPDVLSGWNSDFFDIPYILNRGELLIGKDILRLSPLGKMRTRTFTGKMGMEQTKYHLDGLCLIDYLDVYEKFTMVKRESYKLDAIAEVELGLHKLDYGDMSLEELAKTDWNKFVDYNIHDVQLLVDLEAKLKYIELLRMLSSAGLSTPEAALGTLTVVTGALCCQARGQGEIISTIDRGWSTGHNPGAFVADPVKGFNDYVVSFDANSLYPNIMITLNASPETKVGKVAIGKSGVSVRHTSGKSYEMSKEKFFKWLKNENLTISKAGVLFTQKKRGIIPEFVDRYYKNRVAVRAELKEKKELLAAIEHDPTRADEVVALKAETSRLHIKQHTIKILINSTYGYTGNKRAALGDDDIAASTTLTGQAVIKQSNAIIRNFVRENCDVVTDDEIDKCVVYNDTDSVYMTLDPFVKRGLEFWQGKEVSPAVYELTEQLEDKLNRDIMRWGTSALNSNDCRLVFKRETICDVGCFIAKKHYALHVLDDEGIKTSKYKYKGVKVVRTTMPTPIKPYAKKIIETMMSTKSLEETTRVMNETYELFKTLSPQEIAFVMGINNYEHYAATCNDFVLGKKIPHNVKHAYYYNLVLRKLNIHNKYESIQSGDKVRFLHISPNNKYGIKSIGFKYDYPKEFEEIFEIDYQKMFEKIMFDAVKTFYDAVGWGVRKPWEAVQTELSDIFG